MDKTLRKTVLALTEPFAITARPYAAVAKKLGITEQALISRIAAYQEEGVVRRMGIVYGHFKMGFNANALVVWQVPDAKLEATGKIFATFPAVTHCYARKAYAQWPYDLYTMVHAKTRKECDAIIAAMAAKSGIKQSKVCTTLKEFKKIKTDLREIL